MKYEVIYDDDAYGYDYRTIKYKFDNLKDAYKLYKKLVGEYLYEDGHYIHCLMLIKFDEAGGLVFKLMPPYGRR